MNRLLVTAILLIITPALALAAPADPSRAAHDVMFRTHEPERGLFEGFETSVPPPGWTLVQTNVNDTWFQRSGDAYEGTYYASCLYDEAHSGPQDESLCFTYTIQPGDECLCFYAMASPYWAVDPYQNYNIKVTIDGSDVWNYHDDNNGAVTWQWQRYCVALSSYGAGETISVCLVYEGIDGAEGGFDALSIGECPAETDPCCPSANICYEGNFAASSGGGTVAACGSGPIPWTWGTMTVTPSTDCNGDPFDNQWGTNGGLDYPNQKGQALVFGPFDITSGCTCLGICHYYDTETGFDGGNVKVSTDGGATWELVYPHDGYDDVLDSQTYVAECVGGEEVFTGHCTQYVRDCFDLSDYVGEQIRVGFFFGSDISNQYKGWYLRWLRIGSDMSPVQQSSWGVIKAMYR